MLPASFESNTLTSITLSGAPDTNNPNGQPFLAAVTLATGASPVPEPSTWALMIAGFAGLGWLGYSRHRAIGPRPPDRRYKNTVQGPPRAPFFICAAIPPLPASHSPC